jgi:hypothetical protein
MAMGRRRGYVLAIVAVAVVSLLMGTLSAAIAAGVFASDKGCRPEIEKCPSFIDWHAGVVPGLRVTGILLGVGLLVVVAVGYLMKPQQAPPS